LLQVLLVSLPGWHLAANFTAAPLSRRMAKALCLLRWLIGESFNFFKTAGFGKSGYN
jgi:hypothetical protein